MPIHVQDSQADQLASEICRRTGETIVEAVRTALEERLQRLPEPAIPVLARREKSYEILHRIDGLPVFDARGPEEILGYYAHGMPRCGSLTGQTSVIRA